MMIHLALTEQTLEAFYDSLEHLTGFFLVLVVLLLLWGVTALIGKLFMASSAKAAPGAPPAAVSAAAPPKETASADAEVSAEEIAAIAAAISMLMDGQHRILSIRTPVSSWGQEGRRQHFASHKIR